MPSQQQLLKDISTQSCLFRHLETGTPFCNQSTEDLLLPEFLEVNRQMALVLLQEAHMTSPQEDRGVACQKEVNTSRDCRGSRNSVIRKRLTRKTHAGLAKFIYRTEWLTCTRPTPRPTLADMTLQCFTSSRVSIGFGALCPFFQPIATIL